MSKETKKAVTMTLTPSVVEYLDKIAKREWMSRSSYIDRLIGMMKDEEEEKGDE